ncbi:hypothetical protein BV20DRAFT_491704 [Pilatotrama ljubarskyi]|nr:hypothetical protein BV20DRAFT_491704 [Pilatotrama ljubarskyi]
MIVRTPALYSSHYSPTSLVRHHYRYPRAQRTSAIASPRPSSARFFHSPCCVIATYHILFFAAAAAALGL